jgi:hypothetical protein
VIIGTDAGKELSSGGANTIIGDLAGQSITGQNNVLLGANADGTPTSANTSNKVVIGASAGGGYPLNSDQVIIGYNSAYSLQGFRNTFVGYRTGEDATSADDNVLLGYQAGLNLTQGDSNVIIGSSAGDVLTNVSNLVLIGKDSGGGSLTGADNVFIGTNTGKVATSAEKNVIIGGEAGDALTTADNCVIIGYSAGGAVLSGNNNIFVGKDSGLLSTTGGSNVYIGTGAGQDGTTALENVLTGHLAGENITTGDSNVFVGAFTGDTVTTGDDNIFIGRGSGNPGNGVNPLADSQNNIIIGTEIGIFALGAANATANNNFVLGNFNTDRYYYFGGLDQQINGSDERDKISVATSSLGLDFIRQVQPKTYRWNKRSRYLNEADNDQRFADSGASFGILIQDIIALTGSYPQITSSFQIGSGSYTGGDYYESYAISLAGFLWPTVQAVKDLDGITAKTGSNVFNGTQIITGSMRISGSASTGLFINGLTTTSDSPNSLTYNTTTGRVFYEPTKFISTSSIGDGSTTTFTIAHNLNSRYVQVNIQDSATGYIWYPSADMVSSPSTASYKVNSVSEQAVYFEFHPSYPPSNGQYMVIISK